jgi:hypothetical protein
MLILVAIVAFSILIYLAYLGLVDPNIVAAIVAALTGAFGYWYTQRQTSTRQITEAHRAKKVEIYEKFMDLFDYVMEASKEDSKKKFDPQKPGHEAERLNKQITRGLLIWGSPNLVNKWLEWRRVSNSEVSDRHSTFMAMDQVFRAFRTELDSSNSGLKPLDLVRLFLRNPDDIK